MIEKIIYDYLAAYPDFQPVIVNNVETSPGIPVYMETPVDPPAEYILVEKTGSGEENQIQSAVVAVQSYADTLYRAAQINELAKTAMRGMVSLAAISRVEVNSDYNYTDTRTKKYRYQAIIGIVYKEVTS